MDVGVLAGRHVADDLGEGRGVEPLSVDLGAHVPEGSQRARVPEADTSAGVYPEPDPGRLREPRLPLLEQRSDHDRERRAEVALAGAELDASLRVEALGAHDGRIAAQVHHGLLAGIDAEPAHTVGQLAAERRRVRRHRGHCESAWATLRQFSSRRGSGESSVVSIRSVASSTSTHQSAS